MIQENGLKILIIHQTPYHFETAISIYDNLSPYMNVVLWSSYLDQLGRKEFLEKGRYSLYSGADFDVAVVATGDVALTRNNCNAKILEQLVGKKLVKIVHRFSSDLKANELCLFPAADNFFFMVVSGAINKNQKGKANKPRKKVLIQGNVENRRNYSLIRHLAEEVTNAEFHIIGKKVDDKEISISNVFYNYNLSEAEFREKCYSCDFIMPLIDPKNYSHYFLDRFTTSLLIGFSGLLPFIAHEKLLKIYGVDGFSYENEIEVAACIKQALSISEEMYQEKIDQLECRRKQIIRLNIDKFSAMIFDL